MTKLLELHVVLSDGESTKMLGCYRNMDELNQAKSFYELRYPAGVEFLVKE